AVSGSAARSRRCSSSSILSLLSLYTLFLSAMTVVLTKLALKHHPKSLLRTMESYTRSIRRDTKNHRDLCHIWPELD
ncbi:MAG: hypothetical protein ACKO58_04885, partial [Cyanobium sp.]